MWESLAVCVSRYVWMLSVDTHVVAASGRTSALTVRSTDFILFTLLINGRVFRTSVQDVGLRTSDVDGVTRAGTPLVPARAFTPCVPPLREARSQSFMK